MTCLDRTPRAQQQLRDQRDNCAGAWGSWVRLLACYLSHAKLVVRSRIDRGVNQPNQSSEARHEHVQKDFMYHVKPLCPTVIAASLAIRSWPSAVINSNLRSLLQAQQRVPTLSQLNSMRLAVAAAGLLLLLLLVPSGALAQYAA